MLLITYLLYLLSLPILKSRSVLHLTQCDIFHSYEVVGVERCSLPISNVLDNAIDHVLPLFVFIVSIETLCRNCN